LESKGVILGWRDYTYHIYIYIYIYQWQLVSPLVTCLPSWFPIIFPWGETEEFYANILGLHFYPKILWWSSHPLIFGAWRLVFWFESASPWLLGDVITLLGSKPQVKDMLQIKISFPSPVVTPQLLRQVISGRNYLNCHMKLLHIKQLTQRKLSKCINFFIFILGTIKSLKKQKQWLTTETNHSYEATNATCDSEFPWEFREILTDAPEGLWH